ncbi:hypothetical protein BDR03DRAFT_548612 [Suillus americanus]|nr:hypothetical protein BDR03DRAFT_548612 [Suillus americanus]
MNSFARCPPQAATSVSGILVVLCPALRTISNMFQRDHRLSDDADRWAALGLSHIRSTTTVILLENHCGNEKMTVSRLSIDRTVNHTQTGYRQGRLSGSRTCMKGRAIRTLTVL